MSSELTRILARILDGQRPKATSQAGRALQSILSFKEATGTTDDFGGAAVSFDALALLMFASAGGMTFDQLYGVNPEAIPHVPADLPATFGMSRFGLWVFGT